ncbi:MAG TPA: Ppx/GppA phosphatase family protein [Steroidobacteraceae bacterium]|nr:Ppx/GppA phosphatase family protein [Steroidobacteraceae bacterium]
MSRSARTVPDVLAAVDLGSNSFHLVVARYSHGQLVVIDRLREMVCLAAGVGPDGRLDKQVAARALACLERFGQRLRDMHARSVRVVGTNALRISRRKQAFLERARDAIGHPIEIISGMEEARLIYSGVVHTLPAEPGRRLVIDIGGGSTEIVIGEGYEPQLLESLKLGCVSMSQRFFPDGKLSARRLERARLAARIEIEPVQAAFLKRGWERVVGSSGTVRAIGECLQEHDPQSSGVSVAGLERLLEDMGRAGNVRDLGYKSLTDERRPVFPGGVAILGQLFEALGIEQLRMADGALRDGLLHDMIGRLTDEDPRERTVSSMLKRYHVDADQAARVEATALEFLGQVAGSWELDDPQAELALKWAARLHEIGLDVAHSGYHRHGAYLLENADLPGFAREEQLLLARLVGAHRKKLSLAGVEDLIPPWDRRAIHLIMLLRLSVLLHRGRTTTALPPIELAARARTLELRFPARWLKDHPLSVEDLQLEIDNLRVQGLKLRVYSGNRAAAA